MTTDDKPTDEPNVAASAADASSESVPAAETETATTDAVTADTPEAQTTPSAESPTEPPAEEAPRGETAAAPEAPADETPPADTPTPSVAEMMAAAAPAASEPAAAEPAETPVAEAPPADSIAVPPESPALSDIVPPAENPAPEAAASQTPAPESPAPETPAAEAAAEAAAGDAATDGPSAADRMRQKAAGEVAERPVGNVDLATQRPETPTAAQPIDIPDNDDLDSSLEAEIASAMGAETQAPEAAAAQSAEAEEELGPGSSISGTVQHVHGEDVFVNAGLAADVVVGMKQFPEDKQPAVGDTVNLVVESIDGDGLVRARLPEAKSTNKGGNWDGLAAGQVVDCQVTGTNKGGLQVSLSNLKGFLPASQVDLGYVANMEEYVGQKLTVQITEVNPRKRNLVVSRKVLLLKEREEQQAGFWETLEVGNDYPGTVKTLKPYGAFVSLGPIDGFLHIGEISWSRIAHPNEVLSEGQQIQVRVIKIDREKNRISLGMKQLMQNPWENLAGKYPAERVVNGKVTRTADFGAFVQLEPGVEGLVHISELAWRRVGSVNEVLNVGDERDFKVLEVDPRRKRVSLSLKALEDKPESVRRQEAEEEARPPRKPNPDLRGGMGSGNQSGGLFGNPNDFT